MSEKEVRTVTRALDAGSLGVVLPHEHLIHRVSIHSGRAETLHRFDLLLERHEGLETAPHPIPPPFAAHGIWMMFAMGVRSRRPHRRRRCAMCAGG